MGFLGGRSVGKIGRMTPENAASAESRVAALGTRGTLATPALWGVLAVVVLNIGIFAAALSAGRESMDIFLLMGILLALCQFILGVVALVSAWRVKRWGSVGLGTLGSLGAIAGFFGFAFVAFASAFGGAWGRPLRVRGRQLHPELKAGSDWTAGERPSAAGLDEPTRAALEALWLHDAQKEHASVPAFSRVSWMLAAAGAPAELMEWAHRAALEEIAHTRLCFALAAGYGGRSFTVEPMPDLLLGGLDLRGNALEVLARESLSDGCQLEDFNADVAAECARVCEEPVTRRVLEQIAREERTHAEFSWAVLEWLLTVDERVVRAALADASRALDAYPRPTAVSWDKRALVARADSAAMLKHGRLPDARWGEIWDERLAKTRAQLEAVVGRREAA
jgi:hypothetical protein